MHYYTALLGTSVECKGAIKKEVMANGAILTLSQQIEMLQPFTADDIKQAMFSIDSSKSPGVDGYGSDFYKKM